MNDYTAILTKVRAMRSQLLSPEDIQNNPNLKKPEDIYQLLQKTEGYNRAIREIDMTEFTPKTIIPIINNGVYYTFLKLYRFANLKQRSVLKLYGINMKKKLIKKIIKIFKLIKKSIRNFNIGKIENATTITEVIDSLNETIYAEFFEEHRTAFQAESFDSNVLNVKFDQFVALYIWKKARHVFSEKEIKRFKKYYGSFI